MASVTILLVVVDFVSVFGMLCLLGLFGCLAVGCFAVVVSLVVDCYFCVVCGFGTDLCGLGRYLWFVVGY